jgi:sigma-B regulation protein RsbU (phosphoserine phosphatase)
MLKRLPWRQELAIIDRTMKAISGITDPEELVEAYWTGLGELIAVKDYIALSRRNVAPPGYLITRSSRFVESFNPWTQRDRLPLLSGGLLGEIAYANKPMIIDELPARLAPDDPGHFYLEGFQRLVALPQYDNGESLNSTVMMLLPGVELDESMIPMLHWQTSLFGRGTQNLVLRNRLSDAMATLDKELQVVGNIQRSLLPDALPCISGFEIAADYQTSARAGGDYYDFFPLEGGSWGLFIADVSGHGTPAAVLMAISHAIAHARPRAQTPPACLLKYLNDRLAKAYTRGRMFVTAFYAVLDPVSRSFTYARAGHNPPRLVRNGRAMALDKVGGIPLGILDAQVYEQASDTLERGDLLLLYTDGIIEASARQPGSRRRELFEAERLDNLLLGCGNGPAQDCIDKIRAGVAEFTRDAPPTDDQTLIALRCL